MTAMLCIIDYGSGNISALATICQVEHIPYFISDDPRTFQSATHFILPGVGAFDPTMRCVHSRKITSALFDQVHGQAKPFLGICVGMHVLAGRSEEGCSDGLGWISGTVRKITPPNRVACDRLPHMGWNEVSGNPDDPLLRGIDQKRGFYFLHSYYFDAHDPKAIVSTVTYGADLPCIIRRDHIIGAQFHPEKSHTNGTRFIKNFAGIA